MYVHNCIYAQVSRKLAKVNFQVHNNVFKPKSDPWISAWRTVPGNSWREDAFLK